MGSLARVRVVYAELSTWIQQLPDTLVYGATLEGRDISQLKSPKKGLLVIGNEARGIRPELMERVNVRLTIPRKGGAESLNAAVATGILLSHLS
jgi:TrmH family RNA methyltransferase